MYSIHKIKSYLKKTLRYIFKKAWSRPSKYSDPKIKITKGLFCNELLKMIYNQQPIFSFDEWSFTRAVKTEYSWLPVGKSSSVINDFWKGSASLIMASGLNAQWFGEIKIGTVDSRTFNIFLCKLEKIVTETNSTNSWKPVIILDNSKVHTSNYTKTVKSSLKLEVRPVPPYCPEVAPIEHVFRAIKAKLRSRTPLRTIDFTLDALSASDLLLEKQEQQEKEQREREQQGKSGLNRIKK